MGTATELIDFLNIDKVPGAREWQFRYSYISKTPELLKLRKEYRKNNGLNTTLRNSEGGSMFSFFPNNYNWNKP